MKDFADVIPRRPIVAVVMMEAPAASIRSSIVSNGRQVAESAQTVIDAHYPHNGNPDIQPDGKDAGNYCNERSHDPDQSWDICVVP
jgi:hypothetical protein